MGGAKGKHPKSITIHGTIKGEARKDKQKAIKRQGDIDRLQTDYDQELARLVQTLDSVTHLQMSLRDAFQALFWLC